MQKGAVRVGGITAERGKQAKGFLEVGETPTGPIRIPLVLINGAAKGPVLCLTAGVHATEYPAIDALMRIIKLLKPPRLRGTVIAVPIINLHMFASRMGFVSPIDGLNLNKIAPGNGNGSMTEIVAHRLLGEVISKAQYHVDMHGGDLGEILYPFAGYPTTGKAELDRKGETLARLFTPGLIALYNRGTLAPPPGFLVGAAVQKGVVSILAEAGGDGRLDEEDVAIHVDGVLNIMRFLDMIEGDPVTEKDYMTATGRVVVRARKAGLVHLKVDIRDPVSQGQEIAEIRGVFGDVVETIVAPVAGVPGLIWSHKVVSTGDPVIRIWCFDKAPAFAFRSLR